VAGGSSEGGGSCSRPADEQSTRHVKEPASATHRHTAVGQGRHPVKTDSTSDSPASCSSSNSRSSRRREEDKVSVTTAWDIV